MVRFLQHIRFQSYVYLVCALCSVQVFSVAGVLPEQCTVDYDDRSVYKVFFESLVSGRAGKAGREVTQEEKKQFEEILSRVTTLKDETDRLVVQGYLPLGGSFGDDRLLHDIPEELKKLQPQFDICEQRAHRNRLGWISSLGALIAEIIPVLRGAYSDPKEQSTRADKRKGFGLQVAGSLVRMFGNLVVYNGMKSEKWKVIIPTHVAGMGLSCVGFVAQEEGRKLHPGVPPVMITVGDGQPSYGDKEKKKDLAQVAGQKLVTTMRLDADLWAMGVKKLDDASLTVGFPLGDKSAQVSLSAVANKEIYPVFMGRMRPAATIFSGEVQRDIQRCSSLSLQVAPIFVGKCTRLDLSGGAMVSPCQLGVTYGAKLHLWCKKLLPSWLSGRLCPRKATVGVKGWSGIAREGYYSCKKATQNTIEGSVTYDETVMPKCLGHARPQMTLSGAYEWSTKAVSGDVSARFKKLLPWLASFVHTKKGSLEKALTKTSCSVVPTVHVKAETHGDWKQKGQFSVGIGLDNDNDQAIVSRDWLIIDHGTEEKEK